jgi:hypothetical protein
VASPAVARSMVCRRMGLLDDAIREHLELKRLRGADPGLVSREESEAFGPERGGAPGADDGEIAISEKPAHEDAPRGGQATAQSEGFSNVGQETAELDMRAVLEGEADQDAAPVEPVAAAPVAARPPSSGHSRERGATGDSLDWEMPGESAHEAPAEPSDGDLPGDGSGEEEPIDDVLEETPDFLRDTPEQERLWFEQRPPRDFDFDK